MNRNVLVSALAVVGAITMTSAWAHLPGRMTGGGSFFCLDPSTGGTQRVTHGFELHCKLENEPVREPNNLEINFSGGDNFHLDTLTTAECSDSPSIAEPPPPAGFDTFVGAGTGTFNGLPATISFTFTDAGEPGTSDTGSITIMQGGTTVLTCTNAALTFGNHQAHRALPR